MRLLDPDDIARAVLRPVPEVTSKSLAWRPAAEEDDFPLPEYGTQIAYKTASRTIRQPPTTSVVNKPFIVYALQY